MKCLHLFKLNQLVSQQIKNNCKQYKSIYQSIDQLINMCNSVANLFFFSTKQAKKDLFCSNIWKILMTKNSLHIIIGFQTDLTAINNNFVIFQCLFILNQGNRQKRFLFNSSISKFINF
ncbi:hypothetical protein ABPG74_008838 [Tetrahymena malaccensis]